MRRLDATNIARRESFSDAATRPGLASGFERGDDWTDQDEERATGAPRPSIAETAPAAAAAVSRASAPAPSRPRASGVRTLDATNIARRENFDAPPSGAASPSGFEPAD